MKKLAELLKDEREKKGLSLQEIAQSLKINVKILKAIEENNVDQLPAKTFLRGFVRSYAQYLRLDLNETMNLFQEEFGPSKPDYMYRTTPPAAADATTKSTETKNETKSEPKVSAMPKSEPNSKKIGSSEDYLTGNKALTILGSLFLVIMIVIIAKLIDKYQKEANTEDLNPPAIEKVVSDMRRDLEVLGDCKKMLASTGLVQAMLDLHREFAAHSGKSTEDLFEGELYFRGSPVVECEASTRLGIRFREVGNG